MKNGYPPKEGYPFFLCCEMTERSVLEVHSGITALIAEKTIVQNKEELDQAMDIVMRANFAGDPVTKEETMQLRGLYRYTCRMVLKGMSRKKKFLFRFIKAYA